MKHSLPSRFAYQIGAVGEAGLPDAQLYNEALADAELIHRLGYDAAWVIEHHFSDYYPQPNPLLLLSHVAAKCPGLGLGTAVMVLPWYNPIRFAEDIAMLQTLSEGELHIGMGRGTAKSEYEAFGISMETARSRFSEAWELTRLALKGEPFTFDGEFVKIAEPIVLRPQLSKKMPNFYGAIGSPGSAEIMADLDLPPLCLSNFPDHVLKSILAPLGRKGASARALNRRVPSRWRSSASSGRPTSRRGRKRWNISPTSSASRSSIMRRMPVLGTTFPVMSSSAGCSRR